MFFMGGEAEHSAEHSEDEAALDSFSSEDDLGMFPQGISIAGEGRLRGGGGRVGAPAQI